MSSNRFKFRAWDERTKVMHFDFQFIKSGDESNDWILFVSDKQPVSNYNGWAQNPYFQQQLKIMQFTGLKDKNGVDIYEGDLLEEKPGYIFEAVWDAEYAKFRLQWRTKAIQYPEWNRGRKMAVIGNIYKHEGLFNDNPK